MPLQLRGLDDEAVFSCPAILGIQFGTHDPSGAPKNIVIPCLLHMVDQPNLLDVLIRNAPGAGLFVPRSSPKDILPAYRVWAEKTKEERQISHGVRLSMDLMYQEGVRQGIPQIDVEVMDTPFKAVPNKSFEHFLGGGPQGGSCGYWFQSLEEVWDWWNKALKLRQQRDPYERIPRTPFPDVLKKRSAKKDFRATPDGVEVPVAAYPITYWVVGRWTASELADTDHCQQGPFLAVRKFDAGGADHFKPWDYGFERTHLAAFSAVMVDQQREVMALHTRYGHQNFNDLKETLAAEGIDVDEDCRRQEGGTGARYRRRAGRSDLGHRGFPLVLPGTSPVGRYEGLQRWTQWPAKKFSFQLADEGEGVIGLREAPHLIHLREGHQEVSSTEAQASASSSSSSTLPSSSALPSALPPSLPPPAPAAPSDPSPAQAEASVREAGAAGARARFPSPAVSNRASVDSGESPLPDFVLLGSSMKGTILDPSGPGVLRTPGTVRQHTRAPSRGRRMKDPGPVFYDEKGNRLLGADGEPLGYNWKVERPVFMTYRRGM
uniref:Uncharacterized protein n=1 Tax=Chromera velia CCMP2878 TaxID=1169474 RepID=A0A0G4FKH5_9ALVE|eukprot:Cvel_422.t1-p1 / transcript=Cvel_422.t1 / gene=Cvel_422 / organism=Chromera_velia_CCMP2878 / gene_product=hypothetical protein / transcript_product=hypothetical protein / location=Cvel_scaffold13:199302-201974(+) / protein_length=547 / sequence_SO=supercontig / SO=protein_coding / is_pseudo=false